LGDGAGKYSVFSVQLSATEDLYPGFGLGSVPRIGGDDLMAAFGEEGNLAVAFSFEFEGIALPKEIVRALGLQVDAAALVRKIGIKVEGGAGQRESDSQGGV